MVEKIFGIFYTHRTIAEEHRTGEENKVTILQRKSSKVPGSDGLKGHNYKKCRHISSSFTIKNVIPLRKCGF